MGSPILQSWQFSPIIPITRRLSQFSNVSLMVGIHPPHSSPLRRYRQRSTFRQLRALARTHGLDPHAPQNSLTRSRYQRPDFEPLSNVAAQQLRNPIFHNRISSANPNRRLFLERLVRRTRLRKYSAHLLLPTRHVLHQLARALAGRTSLRRQTLTSRSPLHCTRNVRRRIP